MKQKSFEEFNWKYYGIIWLKIFSSEFEKYAVTVTEWPPHPSCRQKWSLNSGKCQQFLVRLSLIWSWLSCSPLQPAWIPSHLTLTRTAFPSIQHSEASHTKHKHCLCSWILRWSFYCHIWDTTLSTEWRTSRCLFILYYPHNVNQPVVIWPPHLHLYDSPPLSTPGPHRSQGSLQSGALEVWGFESLWHKRAGVATPRSQPLIDHITELGGISTNESGLGWFPGQSSQWVTSPIVCEPSLGREIFWKFPLKIVKMLNKNISRIHALHLKLFGHKNISTWYVRDIKKFDLITNVCFSVL